MTAVCKGEKFMEQKRLSIQIPVDKFRKLKVHAASIDTSLKTLVEKLVDKYFESIKQ
jgi:hypothetical protein